RFHSEPGANPNMRYPSDGPYNQRLGYTYLPYFVKSLQTDDYNVAAQMRASSTYDYFIDRGLYPIYKAKTTTGLSLYDRGGRTIYNASYPAHVFANFDSIPPLLVNTLLYIENRDLMKTVAVTHNPVVEWRRFFYAAFGRALQKFVPGINTGGGSTLAT